MTTYKTQGINRTRTQTLKAAVLAALLLSATAAVSGIQCNGVDITSATGLARIHHHQNVVAGDSVNFALNNASLTSPVNSLRAIRTRFQQEAQGDNVLEIVNQNSRPLRIFLLDQNSHYRTYVGTVAANSACPFHLDRKALYDTYSVEGSLGLLRSSTAPGLTYQKFYSRIVFARDTFGTTAGSVTTADTY